MKSKEEFNFSILDELKREPAQIDDNAEIDSKNESQEDIIDNIKNIHSELEQVTQSISDITVNSLPTMLDQYSKQIKNKIEHEFNGVLSTSELDILKKEKDNFKNENTTLKDEITILQEEKNHLYAMLKFRDGELINLKDLLKNEVEQRKEEAQKYQNHKEQLDRTQHETAVALASGNEDSQHEDIEIYRIENNKLRMEVDQLKHWMDMLQNGIEELIKSNRWKMGDSIGNAINRLTFRPKTNMPKDYINKIINKYNRWKKQR